MNTYNLDFSRKEFIEIMNECGKRIHLCPVRFCIEEEFYRGFDPWYQPKSSFYYEIYREGKLRKVRLDLSEETVKNILSSAFSGLDILDVDFNYGVDKHCIKPRARHIYFGDDSFSNAEEGLGLHFNKPPLWKMRSNFNGASVTFKPKENECDNEMVTSVVYQKKAS